MRQGLSNEKMKALLLLGFALGPLSIARGDDGPDLRKENRFHQIYQRYSSQPTSTQRWDEALARSKNQTYSVQKGDTLWEISQTFFADPHFWPKIWSLNRGIYNPHEISPQQSIQFTPGTMAEPPSLGLATRTEQSPAAPPPLAEHAAGKSVHEGAPKSTKIGEMVDLDLSQIQIPPPQKKSRGPVSIPPSVPAFTYFVPPETKPQLELGSIRNAVPETSIAVTHFAAESAPASLGEILETENGLRTVAEGQEILVKGQGLSPGGRVLAMRDLGPLPQSPRISSFGIQGELEILAPVNSSEGIYRARVVKSYSLVEKGDLLVAETVPQVVVRGSGAMSPSPGKIIGGQDAVERNIFGPYSIVYLSLEGGSGLGEGTRLPVYRNPLVRNSKSLILENPAEIGELQVVRVQDGVATAIIVRQLDDIRVGDSTSPLVQ